MKRAFAVLICLLSVFSVYAEKYSYDKLEDVKKEDQGTVVIGDQGAKLALNYENCVGVVGKVVVKYNGDLERVKEFRDLGSEFAEKESLYRPFGLFADKNLYSDGEIFCTTFLLNDSKDRITYRSKKNKYLEKIGVDEDPENGMFDYMIYYFNGSNKMKLYLPIKHNVRVPAGEKFLYIGTLVYEFEGDDFSFKRLTILDEYDEAQKELNKLLKTDEYKLCRVDLNP